MPSLIWRYRTDVLICLAMQCLMILSGLGLQSISVMTTSTEVNRITTR